MRLRRLAGILFIIIAGVMLFGCGSNKVATEEYVKTVQDDVVFDFSLDNIKINGDVQPFLKEVTIDSIDEGIKLINISMYTDFPSQLPLFEVDIKYPKEFVDALWSSRTWSNRSFISMPNYSRLASDYNIISAINDNSTNRFTIASFDDFENRYTGIDIQEEADSIIFSLNFFHDVSPSAELLEYKAQILIDYRNINYSNTVRESAQWRLDKIEDVVITKLDIDLQPVYSLWYPLHRNVPLKNVTHYFDSIKSMGFRSVLFDDGWQKVVRFDVDTSGYWDPSQTSTINDFINTVHEKGMKVALWYSMPFAGSHQYVMRKFDGKYLKYRASNESPVLDVRYPEVRDYLTKVYSDVVSEWNIDAIWFHFLSGYYPDENVIVMDDLGRDYVSVQKSLDSLKRRFEYEMLYVDPNLNINQSYKSVGPLHTSNLKRVNGFLMESVLPKVREKMVNNRLLFGEYSPFMEVMGIHPQDPEVRVAKKFHSIIFGVPYVSYFSYTLPEGVQETLRFWIKYWKRNVRYLQESDFKAYAPILGYPVLQGGDERKKIFVFYGPFKPFDLKNFDFESADIINSTNDNWVNLTGNPDVDVDYMLYNHKGTYIERGKLNIKRGIAKLEIPSGGYARLIVKRY